MKQRPLNRASHRLAQDRNNKIVLTRGTQSVVQPMPPDMPALRRLPSVDRVLRYEAIQPLIQRFGRTAVRDTVRELLNEIRRARPEPSAARAGALDEHWFERYCHQRLEQSRRVSLRPVFNLTGVVLHTNLGRALLPREAREAVQAVMAWPCNLEYDLVGGARGERDSHIEHLMCRLTGAEAAVAVNNNAAAVLLTLNTLALDREVVVSRGELIEIGGSFRIPDIMASASCRLREVGTTNRTHLTDYRQAIGANTALLMKVHTSNYRIEGFTHAVDEPALSGLAAAHGLPLVADLGSGTLTALDAHGLPEEPTARRSLEQGVDLITFSGDKLLGGPQAGIIAGRKDLIDLIRANPIKRAVRLDKMTLAALEAVLGLYLDPEHLAARLPTLRLLKRGRAEIEALAQDLLPRVQNTLRGHATVTIASCRSQVGSGSLPVETLTSVCLQIQPLTAGESLNALAAAFRRVPIPIIGRLRDNALCLDLRCLEDAQTFVDQLDELAI